METSLRKWQEISRKIIIRKIVQQKNAWRLIKTSIINDRTTHKIITRKIIVTIGWCPQLLLKIKVSFCFSSVLSAAGWRCKQMLVCFVDAHRQIDKESRQFSTPPTGQSCHLELSASHKAPLFNPSIIHLSLCLSSRRCLTRGLTPPSSPSYLTSCPGSSSSFLFPTSNRWSVKPWVNPVILLYFIFIYVAIHPSQAASWFDAAPSGLEDCLQKADKDDLRELLTNQSCLQGQALATGK